MKILAVDPGKTSGWAIMEDANPVEIGTIVYEDVAEWLRDFPADDLDAVVAEDYFIRPKHLMGKSEYQHQWNNVLTARVLGMLEFFASLQRIPFVLQQPSQKVTGYNLIGGEYKKGKKEMHMFDALAHGAVYFSKQGVYNQKALEKRVKDA